MSNDQALEHQEVRDTIATMIKGLHDITERFLNLIMDSIHKIPYAMRYIAMQLRLALHAKFPEAPEEDILKVCIVCVSICLCVCVLIIIHHSGGWKLAVLSLHESSHCCSRWV